MEQSWTQGDLFCFGCLFRVSLKSQPSIPHAMQGQVSFKAHVCTLTFVLKWPYEASRCGQPATVEQERPWHICHRIRRRRTTPIHVASKPESCPHERFTKHCPCTQFQPRPSILFGALLPAAIIQPRRLPSRHTQGKRTTSHSILQNCIPPPATIPVDNDWEGLMLLFLLCPIFLNESSP